MAYLFKTCGRILDTQKVGTSKDTRGLQIASEDLMDVGGLQTLLDSKGLKQMDLLGHKRTYLAMNGLVWI